MAQHTSEDGPASAGQAGITQAFTEQQSATIRQVLAGPPTAPPPTFMPPHELHLLITKRDIPPEKLAELLRHDERSRRMQARLAPLRRLIDWLRGKAG